MTYDVLNKVSKSELIAWMRNNVFLPNISDERFLYEVKLQKLIEKQQELLRKDAELVRKLEENNGKNNVSFMALMVESQKLEEELKKNTEKIRELTVKLASLN